MRYENWPELLSAKITETRRGAFAWGSRDCVMWSGEVVEALTGVDPFADWRGTYSDEAGAIAILDGLGGLETAVTALLPVIDPKYAQRGDLVLVDMAEFTGNPGWPQCVGVCEGERVIVVGAGQLERISMANALVAWEV